MPAVRAHAAHRCSVTATAAAGLYANPTVHPRVPSTCGSSPLSVSLFAQMFPIRYVCVVAQSALSWLSLRHCGLSPQSMLSLIGQLAANETIETLILSYNEVRTRCSLNNALMPRYNKVCTRCSQFS